MATKSKLSMAGLKKEIDELTVAKNQAESRLSLQAAYVTQLANRVDELEKKLDKVERTADTAYDKATFSKTRMEQIAQAAYRTEQFFNEKSIKSAEKNAKQLSELYHANVSMLATVEMVLHTLWRMNPKQRPISLADAALKMVALMGHGPEFFLARDTHSIQTWIEYLQNLTEEGYPRTADPK